MPAKTRRRAFSVSIYGKDDPHGLEEAWEDLRAIRDGPRSEPKPVEKLVWMGLGSEEGQECNYPGYQREPVALRLDGKPMQAEFRPSLEMEGEVRIVWISLWPFYERTLNNHVWMGANNTINIALALTDDGGYLTSTLEALDLL
jgi:hypothetical protein